MNSNKRYIIYKALAAAVNITVLAVAAILCFIYPEAYGVLEGGEFFSRLSPLHIIWALWFCGIVLQFIPSRRTLIGGAKKQFKRFYIPTGRDINGTGYEKFKKDSRRQAALMLLVWGCCVLITASLSFSGLFDKKLLFLLCAALYVADGFCLAAGCPFRIFIMKNRCCRTCRIHNWDRLMTLTPLFFVPGLFSLSLIVPAIFLLILWEITFRLHPERFYEGTNAALMCAKCDVKQCKR